MDLTLSHSFTWNFYLLNFHKRKQKTTLSEQVVSIWSCQSVSPVIWVITSISHLPMTISDKPHDNPGLRSLNIQNEENLRW